MADIEKCENCKAWDCGRCHRFPPRPLLHKGAVYGYNFPVTASNDWCMEFMRRGPHESRHTEKARDAKQRGK